ncbi:MULTISPECIES: pyridoxal-dependent decarboxylase [unclassified Wenzhouxiangella]|uniref:pyridoxal phosphate-dependent decarboxylase family protein n=1 Tax=unclassified Wenzhouxiangella TaxID=2613841 RepID=UPI000E32588B|nr:MULTISPECIES: pyridoxal-dependent decarboxylase [unclassified Wenzhouxiangella]RFF28041.1 aspartate aminotransferase family protein [Wenzhouxiangella sp. 15181]RFP68627.1 aspartate aminotransferase family protein [Wenzhouxiangella sp. 15190]
MDSNEFRRHAHALVDWMADYIDTIEEHPVKARVAPGEIAEQLPTKGPQAGEDMAAILADFRELVLPGMTHWQHPMFMGYFPANSSYPSVLAEMLTATLGAQCMSWETSPAAAELEGRVMEWLRDWLGLPADFEGVIQDTASTATLCALLSARERATGFLVNEHGFADLDERRFAIYCSTEAHSSVEKDVKIAGFGSAALRKIPVDTDFAMRPEVLAERIESDLAEGVVPLCVIAALGTTSSTAIDPIDAIGVICAEHGTWFHVDAAYAGTALLLPEFRWMLGSAGNVDSFVVNPHKWMATNFDCTAYYVRDVDALVRTFEIQPEYLRTRADDQVRNYRDWGIQLGRRFRALKLWFVMRSFGLDGLQAMLRRHIEYGQWLAETIDTHPGFERLAPAPLNCVCFRWLPPGGADEAVIEKANQRLLANIQDSGKLYLTHTRLDGRYALRIVPGQTRVERFHIEAAWALIEETARNLAVD